MATVVLTSTPTVLDPGASTTDLLVVNSGSSAVHLLPAEQRLRPGQSLHVQPGGQAVSAYALTGSGQVDVTVLATAPAAPGGGPSGTYAPWDGAGAADGYVAAWDSASGKLKPKPGPPSGAVIDPRDYGANVDAVLLQNVTSTAAGTTLSCATASFTAGDVGKAVWVFQTASTTTGTATTIASVQSATQVTLAAAAGITLTNSGFAVYGTDDTAAFQAALNAAGAASRWVNGGANLQTGPGMPTLTVPRTPTGGAYIITGHLTAPNGIAWDSSHGFGYFSLPTASPYTKAISFGKGTWVKHLAAHFNLGSGIEFAVSGDFGWYHNRIDFLELWATGEQTNGSSFQDAVSLQGTDYRVGKVYIKGGSRGLVCGSGSDLMLDEVFCIGNAAAAVQFNNTSQVNATIKLDSCKASGVVLNQGAKHMQLHINAFINGSLPTTAATALEIGQTAYGSAGSNPQHTNIQAWVNAADIGAPVVKIDRADGVDVFLNVATGLTDTGQTPKGAMTAVVYGSNNIGQAIRVHGTYGTGGVRNGATGSPAATPAVVPYSGTLAGVHEFTQWGTRYILPADAPRPNQTFDMSAAGGNGVTLTSGTVYLTYKQAETDITLANLDTYTRGTAAATVTLNRVGVYTEASNGDLTLVARSAASTTTWASTQSMQSQVLAEDGSGGALGTVVIRKGQWYANGVISVATTPPALAGVAPGSNFGNLPGQHRRAASFVAQTDLPATIPVGSLANSANLLWAVTR